MHRRIRAAWAAILPALLLTLTGGCGSSGTYVPALIPNVNQADFTLSAPNPTATATGTISNISYNLLLTSVNGFAEPVTLRSAR